MENRRTKANRKFDVGGSEPADAALARLEVWRKIGRSMTFKENF